MNPHTHPHQGHGSSPISPHVSHAHPQGQTQPQPLPSIRGGFQLPPPVPSYATYAVGQGAGVGQGGSSSYYNNNYIPPPPPPQHSNTPPVGGVPTNPASSGTLSMHDFEPAGGGGVGGIASVLQPSSTYHTQYSASAPSAHPPPPPQSHSPAQPSQNPTPAQPQQTPSPTLTSARRHTTKSIGKFITFASGPFKGRTVRAELVEVQKADLGRKCADPPTSTSTNPLYPSHSPSSSAGNVRDRDGPEGSNVGRDKDRLNKDREKEKEETKNVRKDRRPLDPPPVVSLKYFEMIHYGEEGQYEREIPAEEVEIGGLICQVDLFRVTIPPSEAEVQSMQMQAAQQIAHAQAMPLPGVHHYPPGSSLPGVYGSAPLPYQAPPGQQQLHQQWSATPPYDQQGGPTNQGPNYPYPPHPHQHLQSQSQPHPHLPPIDTQAHAQSPVLASPAGEEDQRKRRRTGTITGQSAGIQGGLLRDESRFGRLRADSLNESLSSRDRERLRDRDREDERSRDRGDTQSSPVSPYAQTSQSHGYQHPYNTSASSPPYQNSSSSAYPPSSAYTPSSASTAFVTAATAYTPPGSVGGVGPMGGGMGGMGIGGSSGPGAPINPDELPLPTEADKLTRCLFGEYYSHAASILDLKGKAVIYFVFSVSPFYTMALLIITDLCLSFVRVIGSFRQARRPLSSSVSILRSLLSNVL